MKLNAVEIGEQYGDGSGWERRVALDIQDGKLEIDLSGSHLSTHPRDLDWLIAALQKARDSVFGS